MSCHPLSHCILAEGGSNFTVKDGGFHLPFGLRRQREFKIYYYLCRTRVPCEAMSIGRSCLKKDADVGTCEVEHLENSSEGDAVRSGQK